jgi:hypothetical protein
VPPQETHSREPSAAPLAAVLSCSHVSCASLMEFYSRTPTCVRCLAHETCIPSSLPPPACLARRHQRACAVAHSMRGTHTQVYEGPMCTGSVVTFTAGRNEHKCSRCFDACRASFPSGTPTLNKVCMQTTTTPTTISACCAGLDVTPVIPLHSYTLEHKPETQGQS